MTPLSWVRIDRHLVTPTQTWEVSSSALTSSLYLILSTSSLPQFLVCPFTRITDLWASCRAHTSQDDITCLSDQQFSLRVFHAYHNQATLFTRHCTTPTCLYNIRTASDTPIRTNDTIFPVNAIPATTCYLLHLLYNLQAHSGMFHCER